jgi:hypothetical protein
MKSPGLARGRKVVRSHAKPESGGGGNRTRETNCCNDLLHNDLQQGENSLGAFWEWTQDGDCHLLSSLANEHADSIRHLVAAWPLLPPHIREAIVTMIDAAKCNSRCEGVSP